MRTAAALSVTCLLVVLAAAPAPAQRTRRPSLNRIQRENALPGSRGWLPDLGETAVSAFSYSPSVTVGDTLRLAVSAPAGSRYRIVIYRLGWYRGAGAREVGCLPSCTGSRPGAPRAVPPPAADGEVIARWPVTGAVRVPAGWVSGYYLARVALVGTASADAYGVPFVVRAPAGNRSAILVEAPVNTWQAYNDSGGFSLYTSADGRKVQAVSFLRPYHQDWSQSPLFYDYPLVRFLERNGYDVSYTTDVDVDADPTQLLHHRVIVVAGHSEYWTSGMRAAFERARDAGVDLAFMGGNDVYWQVRYGDDRTTIVAHATPPPGVTLPAAQQTVRFRDIKPTPEPECTLLGNEWQGGWTGATAEVPFGPETEQRDYTVTQTATAEPWLAGTGLAAGDVVRGVVGYEWDALMPGCTPGAVVLFHRTGVPTPSGGNIFKRTWLSSNADAVTYTAPSGARVFSAGSIDFSWGLDGFARSLGTALTPAPDRYPPDPRLQRFVRNMLDDMAGRTTR